MLLYKNKLSHARSFYRQMNVCVCVCMAGDTSRYEITV